MHWTLQADFSPGVTHEGVTSVEVEDVADVYDAEMMLQQVQVRTVRHFYLHCVSVLCMVFHFDSGERGTIV